MKPILQNSRTGLTSLRSTLCAALLLSLGIPGPLAAAQATAAAPNADLVSKGEQHTYRLIYSVSESDGNKRLGIQHYAMTLATNGRATLKEGDKIPVMTGGVAHGGAPDATQYEFTYLDVGLNLDASLAEEAGGLELKVKVEQSSILDNSSSQDTALKGEPIVRQMVLQNSAMVQIGKPVVIGSLDVPGSTRHLDIEVTLERMP